MPAAFEEIQAFIAARLSHPVSEHTESDGTLVLTGGDPPEVVVRITPASVVVAEYSLRWEGPLTARVRPIVIGSVRWGRLSEEGAMQAIKALITAARNVRMAKFRTCAICGERNAPEWMHDDTLCEGCAEGHFDVVH
jgi:hypothetical protein